MFKDRKTDVQLNQQPRFDADTEAKIKDQSAQQQDNRELSGLFSSAFAHVTELPPMTEAYVQLNARMNAKRKFSETAEDTSKDTKRGMPPLTSDLPKDGEQPILH